MFERIQEVYGRLMARLLRVTWAVLLVYFGVAAIVLVVVGGRLGTDIFPAVDTGQFQLRLRVPTGTRVEETERVTLKALETIREEAGGDNVAITLSFVGTPPPNYPINYIYLWTSGPQEAVLLVALKRSSGIRLEDLQERLRAKLPTVPARHDALVRSGRHREPDHEPRRCDAD
jgi:multidrug efflux pump subunit AcrB